MATLYQKKLISFHSELRKKDIETKLNTKRYILTNFPTRNQKSLQTFDLSENNFLEYFFTKIQRSRATQNYWELLPIIKDIRMKYIYEKNHIDQLNGLIEILIDLCLLPEFLPNNENLFYEISWILINFTGLCCSKISKNIREKIMKIFVLQINNCDNIKINQEV